MNAIANNAVSILTNRLSTIVILIVTLVGRIFQQIYFFNIRSDVSFQLIATKNFLDGNGITLDNANASDLSKTDYQPLTNWPPGYSFIASPFYELSGNDYILTALSINLISSIALVLLVRAILKQLSVSQFRINIATIVSGFFIYPFYLAASTDQVAITFFLAAIYTMLDVQKSGGNRVKFFYLTVTLVAAGLLKYQFIPITFFPLQMLWVKPGKINRKLPLIICFLVLIGSFVLLALYQQSVSGSAAYISSKGRDWYPEHLLRLYPFVLAAFLQPETLITAGLSATIVNNSWQIISLFLILFVSIRLLGLQKEELTKNTFWQLTLLISIFTLVMLAYLSLTVAPEQRGDGIIWTYVETARYFGLPVVLIQIAFFSLPLPKSRLILLSIGALCILLMMETARGIVFSSKRILSLGKEEYSWQYEQKIHRAATTILQSVQDADSLKSIPVVLAGSSYYINHRVALNSDLPLFRDSVALREAILPTSADRLLFFVLEEDKLKNYERLISGRTAAGRFEKYLFYLIHVRR